MTTSSKPVHILQSSWEVVLNRRTLDRASSSFATWATSQMIRKSTLPRRDPRDGDESPYNRSNRNLLEIKLRTQNWHAACMTR